MLGFIPKLGSKLSKEQINFLEIFAKGVRHSVLAMTTNAESGHPGGSLGCADYLTLLYAFILSQTGDPVIISNGHISSAVYGVLAEMGYISKNEVVAGFRKSGQPYEGHVTRHVPGVWYGTGPLGAGVGAASGFALAGKIKGENKHVFALVGDGESEEGQVYEMANFASKYRLDNFIVFMDYNHVQLTASLEEVMPYNPRAVFSSAGWHVVEANGHDFQDMWRVLSEAVLVKNKPIFILGNTIMGKGVDFMEAEGRQRRATWHGSTAKIAEAAAELGRLALTKKDDEILSDFRARHVKWNPAKAEFGRNLEKMAVNLGRPRLYKTDAQTDCRTAYGKALLDLAYANKNIVALTADLAGSVKTQYVKDEIPERHFDVGVAEQQLVSCSGGLSLSGIIPFCSTFGAFLTSRPKDQARVNDINECNVKMVATHCGLSVGEDGPTHQAIDDSGSVLGFFNTMQIEPADPNHCDRIIRFIAGHYGNFYVRMGRHKIPVLASEDGSVFFDEHYEYNYGKCDVLRAGADITIAAMGSVASEALKAWVELKECGLSAEIVIVSSIKKFDSPLFDSIKKTKKIITVEDHNTLSGLGGQLARNLESGNICVEAYKMLGVEQYQLSGRADELYAAAGIDAAAIVKNAKLILK
ncbi:MAG: transketolase [Patescibacteria group bacterium]